MAEQRKHPRAYAAATVSVFSAGRLIGVYLAQNLSVGGALLESGPPIVPGTELRLVVRLHSESTFEVRATALRHVVTSSGLANVAVAFRHVNAKVELAIQAAVLNALASQADASVLVVHCSAAALVCLSEAVIELGYRALLAFTPLEAMRWICHPDMNVHAALVDAAFDSEGAGAFFRFLRGEFPRVRRVLVGEMAGPADVHQALESGDAQAILLSPWTSSSIDAAMRDGLRACSPDAGHSK